MKTPLLPLTVLFAFSLGVSGCDQLGGSSKSKSSSSESDDDDSKDKKKKKKKKSDDGEDEPKATSAPTATAAPTAAPSPQPTETAAPAPLQPPDAAPTASGSEPPAGPNGRSAVPTLEEWSKVGEVTVLGSGKLDCETKKVREWIRVSCRGESRERGKPTGVRITHGGGKGDTFTFASGGVASLIYPFFQGQHLEATFTWERTRRGFKAEWPHGAPQPTAYGIFEGGDAHLKP